MRNTAMDFFGVYWILFFTLTIFFLSSCAVFLTRGRRPGLMKGAAAPVVVTSATHTAPGGYPVTQIPAATYQPQVYGTPYPVQTTGNVTVQMPMPAGQPSMPGMQPYVAPYPPAMHPGAGVASMNPPSYDMAMANAPSVMPAAYEKQMPYNPNYAQ